MTNKNLRNILIGVFVLIVFVIISIPYYMNYIAPFRRTVITVDEIKIPMDYFLTRIKQSGSDPIGMLQTLTDEQLIKIGAPNYNINITEADINKQLRLIAGNGEENISDIEFKEWYRQQLNNTGMSDSEYKELVKTNLLMQQLHVQLAEKVPEKAEQVHLHLILTKTYEDAQKASSRLKAGENFKRVAQELSVDPDTKSRGGDLGWMPPTISTFADQIAALEINKPSEPTPYFNRSASSSQSGNNSNTPDAFYILMISEKNSDMQLSQAHFQILQENALQSWLQEEIKKHQVNYNFNSEVYAWINWQLQKK